MPGFFIAMSKFERITEIIGVIAVLIAVCIVSIKLGESIGGSRQKEKTDATIIELQDRLGTVTRERDKYKHDAEKAEHALDVFQEAK